MRHLKSSQELHELDLNLKNVEDLPSTPAHVSTVNPKSARKGKRKEIKQATITRYLNKKEKRQNSSRFVGNVYDFQDDILDDDLVSILSTLLENNENPVEEFDFLRANLLKLKNLTSLDEFDSETLFNLFTKLSKLLKNGHEKLKKADILNLTVLPPEIILSLQTLTVCLELFHNQNIFSAVTTKECFHEVYLLLSSHVDAFITLYLKLKKKNNFKNMYEKMLIKNVGLMENIIKLNDVPTKNLTCLLSSCLHLLVAVQHDNLQQLTFSILLQSFKKHEELQSFVLNEIIFILRNLSEHHKFTKTFVINENQKSSYLTGLLLMIAQSMITSDFNEDISLEDSLDSFKNMFTVVGVIVMLFFNKCKTSNDDHKQFRQIVIFIVEELLALLLCPEWPSVVLFLQLLSKPMAETILKPKESGEFKAFCLKVLYKIAAELLTYQQLFENKQEKKLPLQYILNYFKSQQSVWFENSFLIHKILWISEVYEPSMKIKDKNKLISKLKELREDEKKQDVNYSDVQLNIYNMYKSRKNFNDFNIYFNYILKCCFDVNKKVKGLASQYLSDLINQDLTLLQKNNVIKVIEECLKSSSATSRESMASVVGTYITETKTDTNKYLNVLIKLLDDQNICVRKKVLCVLSQILNKKASLSNESHLVYKLLSMIQDTDTNIQAMAIKLLNDVWFDTNLNNLQTLITVVCYPNAINWLKQFFEDILKPRSTPITADTQSQPDTQVTQVCSELVKLLFLQLKTTTKISACLHILLVIAEIIPKVFDPYVEDLSRMILNMDPEQEYLCPQLATELLTIILPSHGDHDVKLLEEVYTEITSCVQSAESFKFPSLFLISLMKLIKLVAALTHAAFVDEWLIPNTEVLTKHLQKKQYNENIIVRSIYICGYLVNFKTTPQQFDDTLKIINSYLENPKYCSTVLHVMGYVCLEDKTLFRNKCLTDTVSAYLKDRNVIVYTKAALFVVKNYLTNWKVLNSSTNLKVQEESSTDLASSFVQKCLTDILECTSADDLDVRCTAYDIVQLILNNGFVIEPKLIPYIICMTTDPNKEMKLVGLKLLKGLSFRKTFDLARCFVKGLNLSQNLHSKLFEGDLIRGYNEINGIMKAKNDSLYVLLQEEKTARRYVIDGILGELKFESLTSTKQKLFFTDELMTFSYKYPDEVLYLLRQIITLFTATTIPDEYPTTAEQIKHFTVKYYGCYLLTLLKKSLQNLYSISDQKIDNYFEMNENNKEVWSDKLVKQDYIPTNIFNMFNNTNKLCQVMYKELKRVVQLELLSSQSVDEQKQPIVDHVSKTKTTRIVKTTKRKGQEVNNNNETTGCKKTTKKRKTN